MNPFDLRGPDFLIFYFCLSVVVILVVWALRRNAESGEIPKIDLSDPYLIAFLRGGQNEALRLAVVSLIDRGLLTVNDTSVVRTERATREDARNSIEYEVLKKFGVKTEATSIFKDELLKKACAPHRAKLEQAGLLPDQSMRSDRMLRFVLALMVLDGVGLARIAIGISRGQPVAFLIILAIVALILLAFVAFPRLTTRGRSALKDIRAIYAGLKDRANSIHRGTATAEMTMLAAVFGIAALTPTDYAFARTIFPQAGSSGCGASCGSSGGDGGGCGGGGCGGCGS